MQHEQFPSFYCETLSGENPIIELDESSSRHAIQVLRMKRGDRLNLTDGKGNLVLAAIEEDNRKKCMLEPIKRTWVPGPVRKISIGISLIKNSSRFEWFLEKATEIGVSEIIPLLCDRTEKQTFRRDRLEQICISAMLQSRQNWLPALSDPVKFKDLRLERTESSLYLIAHCKDGEKASIGQSSLSRYSFFQILVGPEGDFTEDEIKQAVQLGYHPVSLGSNRLRTETAGIAAAVLFNNC